MPALTPSAPRRILAIALAGFLALAGLGAIQSSPAHAEDEPDYHNLLRANFDAGDSRGPGFCTYTTGSYPYIGYYTATVASGSAAVYHDPSAKAPQVGDVFYLDVNVAGGISAPCASQTDMYSFRPGFQLPAGLELVADQPIYCYFQYFDEEPVSQLYVIAEGEEPTVCPSRSTGLVSGTTDYGAHSFAYGPVMLPYNTQVFYRFPVRATKTFGGVDLKGFLGSASQDPTSSTNISTPKLTVYPATRAPGVYGTGDPSKDGRGFTKAPKPTISGTVAVGKTLTAKPGAWSPSASFGYQWFRSGRPVSGKTSSTYKLTSKDVGKKISVTVTGSRSGYATSSVTSAATKKVPAQAFPKAVTVTVKGTPKVGKTLTAKVGYVGTSKVTVKIQWYRSGSTKVIAAKVLKDVSKTVTATYKLKSADKGKTITAKVTVSKTGYTTATKKSKATAKITR